MLAGAVGHGRCAGRWCMPSGPTLGTDAACLPAAQTADCTHDWHTLRDSLARGMPWNLLALLGTLHPGAVHRTAAAPARSDLRSIHRQRMPRLSSHLRVVLGHHPLLLNTVVSHARGGLIRCKAVCASTPCMHVGQVRHVGVQPTRPTITRPCGRLHSGVTSA